MSTSQLLPQEGTRLVAKIYDPLYFNDDEGYLNPFLCMDKYYTHEANAYSFSEWIDWDWDSWLEAEFTHTVSSITPELLRESWLMAV
ncbi:hypothetical protein P175DRAFT_0440763 [Aspergillus ochraceoroseus IBT 24754]|uniref:Uncharacterized protein n=1 Tax=Aspergillus ochraceoroseus IBT 24754 TaxID=1392256 RepID=A0A2T5LS69_9EURO|nr:uncharacterized protein P175DRAFT_0440763 [Aspergillus ochraceoroseus IBT 24754]PTU19128.1 hypothetical protein P175DRAFT_0440763 [Aspergillus ochraceoroseus IBT 24754]